MPRQRLALLWWLVVGLYLLAAAAFLVAWATPRLDGWPIAVALLVMCMGVASMFFLRPRPFDVPDEKARRRPGEVTLRAIRRGQPDGGPDQRRQAIDWGRRALHWRAAPVLFVSYVALINVDSEEGLPFVRKIVVVAVVAAGLALVLARRRMAQLDRWED